MSNINPLNLFGVNPNSQYAQLFVDIYHLTKMNLDLIRPKDELENVSDSEDGEIDDYFHDQSDRNTFAKRFELLSGNAVSNNNSHDSMDWNGNPNLLSTKKKIKKKAMGIGNSKFLIDLESQFNIDKSPDRLEWMQCYLGELLYL